MSDEKIANFMSSSPDAFLIDPTPIEDHSEEVEEWIRMAESYYNSNNFETMVEDLLNVEKKCRQSLDGKSTSRIICYFLEKLKCMNNYKKINEYVRLFNKKRGQLKKPITDMIQLCKKWLYEEMDKKVKYELINTLCAVTQGKIFVEVERSEIIQILSKMKEKEGNIEEAASVLQEVQVDTFISMGKREKTEYLLEQMRLVLLKNDYIRCQVISKKIDPKLLETEEYADLKLKFFKYMSEYYIHEESYSDVAKCYEHVLNTKCVKENLSIYLDQMKFYIVFLVLSPHTDQQSKFLNIRKMEKNKLKEIPVLEYIVNDFLSRDLIHWPLSYEKELISFPVFSEIPFTGGALRWSLFKKKVLFHNIYVMSSCYDRISLNRLAELLNEPIEATENLVSELVSKQLIVAKIDRLNGIVKFGYKHKPEDTMNEWSAQINQILDILEESSHLIQKEKMLHEAKMKRMQLEGKSVFP